MNFNNGALSSRLRRRFALPDFDDAELLQLLMRSATLLTVVQV